MVLIIECHNSHKPVLTTPIYKYVKSSKLLYTFSSGRIIQVHRNPADVAVSFYYHMKSKTATRLSYNWNEYITKLFYNKKQSE